MLSASCSHKLSLSFELDDFSYVPNSRVALTPAATATLVKKGFTVNVEAGAGFEAKFRDDEYKKAGGVIVDDKTALQSDILLKVRQPNESEIPLFKPNSTLISFLYPAKNKALIDSLSKRKMNAFGEENGLRAPTRKESSK